MQGARFGSVDFDQFHAEVLPALLKGRGRIFTDSDASVIEPLAFELDDGRAYTYLPSHESFSIVEGVTPAHTVVELSHEDWCDFVWELKTSFALLYAQRLEITRGSFSQLVRWEPALRVAFDGQLIYDIDDPAPVVDDHGDVMDLERSFVFADSDEVISDFLDRTGFVHLREVMSRSEVDALRTEVEVALTRARPDDKRSWWTTVGGEEVCNRVNYLNDHSALIAGLGADDRFQRIAALGGTDLRDAHDRLDGNSVVIKVPGATTGLADLPWHRDCGMGGHPVKCPMLNVGIQLDAATAATGQLVMIAGSHRGTSRLPGPREASKLPAVAITTEPGDVTVHFGHTLHAAPPPAGLGAPGRRALYISFIPPLTFEMVGPGQGYNDVLFTRDEGRVRHVDHFR